MIVRIMLTNAVSVKVTKRDEHRDSANCNVHTYLVCRDADALHDEGDVAVHVGPHKALQLRDLLVYGDVVESTKESNTEIQQHYSEYSSSTVSQPLHSQLKTDRADNSSAVNN